MSYRAFKRLLGETSLERKCRFLFGGFILVLMTASFWLYARQTEHIAYDQLTTTSRLLVNHIVAHQIATQCRPPGGTTEDLQASALHHRAALAGALGAGSMGPLHMAALLQAVPRDSLQNQRALAMGEFREGWEGHWPRSLREFKLLFLKPDATSVANKPDDDHAHQMLKEFLENPRKTEDDLHLPQDYHYYAAVRASTSCLSCHQQINPAIREGGIIAVIKIKIKTEAIVDDVHINRAVLICTALATALFIMGASWLIVRYVIVKPVKHLKEVSDAISAGELNVRSEIQTGDEFEDLSHAFNRMLRNLVAMQDRLRKVNADLDRKVDELAQANLALFELNQLKSDFLATISHELRTPLNSILGFSDVLLENVDLTEKQKRWVNNIRSSGERLLNLINDILDLAKIEAGKMEVKLEELSCYDVCEGLLTMFRPMAEKKNIELKSQMAPGIPMLRQDVGKFQQILSNLLSNAIKFTPEGGRVSLRAETAPEPSAAVLTGPGRDSHFGPVAVTGEGGSLPPRELILTVTDTGVGIPLEEQELVFEKFRQGANPLTRDHAGSGLGLSITRELTRLLGGEVSLESELGRGSTFTVRLPLYLSEEPRLELDLTRQSIDLSKAQRIDSRLYGARHGAGE